MIDTIYIYYEAAVIKVAWFKIGNITVEQIFISLLLFSSV